MDGKWYNIQNRTNRPSRLAIIKDKTMTMTKDLVIINGKTIIISGCPRSGTSLCMDIQRATHGSDIIMSPSQSFKDDDKTEDEIILENQLKHLETIKHPGQKIAIGYLMSRSGDRFPERKSRLEKRRKRSKEAQDMNPNGFLEHPFTVQGIRFQPEFREDLQRMLNEPTILKVVSQGLQMSDPMYVGKMVYMLRHPRAVAKSQERLQRPEISGKDKEGRHWDLMKRFVIHTPQMFINVSLIAMQFFIDNPGIPIKIVQYEELLADPDAVVQSIYDFVGLEGDVEAGKAIVEQKLNRSKHQDIESPLWDESEYIHDAMCCIQKLFDKKAAHKEVVKIVEETLDYMSQPGRENSLENQAFHCFRANKQVKAKECELCMLCPEHRENLRAQSEKKLKVGDRSWVDEPCMFEIGMDVKRTKYVSSSDSIYLNFWRKRDVYPLEEKRAEK